MDKNIYDQILALWPVTKVAQATDRYESEVARQPRQQEEQTPFDSVDEKIQGPVRNIRKTYIQQGGLGTRVSMDGYYSPHEMKKYQCIHCKVIYTWTPDLDFTDFGDVIDNLCSNCRKELRTMRTNHPEMK